MQTNFKIVILTIAMLVSAAGCSRTSTGSQPNANKQGRANVLDSDVVEAVSKGHAVTLKSLLDTGMVDVNAVNERGDSYMALAQNGRDDRVSEILLAAGADPNLALPGGTTPFLIAAGRGSSDSLRAMLKHGGKVDSRDAKGRTPLSIALEARNSKNVLVLLENGADPNTPSESGVTPLMFAVGSKDKELVKVLLERKADVNAKAKNGMTPLMAAVFNKSVGTFTSVEIVELLLEKGADVNATSTDGTTALMLACHNPTNSDETVTIVRRLLEHGADPKATNQDGMTALSIASRNYYVPRLQEVLASR